MPSRIKITIIGHDKVYPPIAADAQRFFHLSKHLSEKFKVLLIGHSGLITRYRKYNINKNFDIIEIPDLIPIAIGTLGYFVTKKPLFDPILAFTCRYSPRLLKHYIKNAEESKILIFEGCWHTNLLDKIDIGNKLIIYDARNVEYLLKKQAYDGIFKKKILPKIFDLEKKLCTKSDILLATCKEEKEKFVDLYKLNESKVYVTQPGINLPKMGRKIRNKTVLFMGGAYFANFEAVDFIIKNLAKSLPEFTFRIVGRAGMNIERKLPKNVEIHGFISEEKKDEILRTSEIAINPIIHGAGVNVKMLEYMAYGLPIITSRLGARGIKGKPFVISDLNGFAVSIQKLSSDLDMMKKLGSKSRDVIKKNYTWPAVTKNISEIFLSNLKKKNIRK